MDDKKGVWRTVGGRRIFIAEGEDLATAMKNSGKFNKNTKSPHQEAERTFKKAFDEDTKELFKNVKGKNKNEAIGMVQEHLKKNTQALQKYGSDYVYQLQTELKDKLGLDIDSKYLSNLDKKADEGGADKLSATHKQWVEDELEDALKGAKDLNKINDIKNDVIKNLKKGGMIDNSVEEQAKEYIENIVDSYYRREAKRRHEEYLKSKAK